MSDTPGQRHSRVQLADADPGLTPIFYMCRILAVMPRRSTPRRRGRPVRGQEGNQRAALLRATREICAARGTHAATVRSIARRARVDPALVRYYFGSRDGLLRAVIEEAAREGRERFVAAAPASSRSEDRLRAVVTHLLGVLRADPYLPRLIVERVILGDARARERYVREVVAPVATVVAGIVEEGTRRGEFRDVNPLFLLQSIVGTCVFFFLAAPVSRRALGIDPRDVAVVDAFVQHTVELLLRGVLR